MLVEGGLSAQMMIVLQSSELFNKRFEKTIYFGHTERRRILWLYKIQDRSDFRSNANRNATTVAVFAKIITAPSVLYA